MTRMMVGFMGIRSDFISSRTIPMMDRITIRMSSWFHLRTRYLGMPSATTFMESSSRNTAVKK
ncbi:unnamed protein product [Ixodes pacificus]